uniref:Uncharacterized protein n=1 Tax=viral metagenome TaxID=1070528 RepID=A0A6C0DSF5_9ZZZZ
MENKINSIYRKILFMETKKYIYANVQIPIEIDDDTQKYTPLKEYIQVTFNKCDVDPHHCQQTNPLVNKSMAEIIGKLFEQNSDVSENSENAPLLWNVLRSEIKKKQPSKNITFKHRFHTLNKRNTAKVHHNTIV